MSDRALASLKNAPYTSIFQCGILIAGTVPCANIPETISATNNYAQYGDSGFGTLAGAPNGTGGNYSLSAGLPSTSPNGVALPGVDPATATNLPTTTAVKFSRWISISNPLMVEQYSLGIQKDFAENVLGINYVGKPWPSPCGIPQP